MINIPDSDSKFLVSPDDPWALGRFYEDADGDAYEFHAMSCPCPPCRAAEAEERERASADYNEGLYKWLCKWTEEGGKGDGDFTPEVLIAKLNAVVLAELDREWEWAADDLLPYPHTLPLIAGSGENIPAVLSRSDGQTLLYQSRLNSLFGEPSAGKSFIATMVVHRGPTERGKGALVGFRG